MNSDKMSLAEIITIGDELLIGQVVDTNSAWMAQQLNAIGVSVKQITSVSDDETHIISALHEAEKRANIILITGGLGPTKDDITKITLCKFFKSNLRFDQEAFLNIERIFKARGRGVTDVNRKQAEVPEKCTALQNSKGTAPGMWFEKDGKVYASMPGVPHEMKAMMRGSILPLLEQKFDLPSIVHRTILTQGIGESMIAEMIADWEEALPKHIKLAYLPAAGTVRLRMSAYGKVNKILTEELKALEEKLLPLIYEYVYGFEDESLEKNLGHLLTERKETLAISESCSGGYLSHRITSVPGSSAYYMGSIVAYDNKIKIDELGVTESQLKNHGAVSEDVVKTLAESIRKKFNTNYGIATTGIAGPTGGSEEKPVGTVFIALATPEKAITKKLILGSSRERIIIETAQHAMRLLQRELESK